MTANEGIRLRSGPVSMNLYKKEGEYGEFLDVGKLSYRYVDKNGEVDYSEYLKASSLLNGAFCLLLAHIVNVIFHTCKSTRSNWVSTVFSWIARGSGSIEQPAEHSSEMLPRDATSDKDTIFDDPDIPF